MSTQDNNRIQESSLEQLAEIREHLESLEILNEKIVNKEFPTNEETHKLLKELIEELKKPCQIELKLK